ncbi:MAG TPA: hypothetical protein V6D05_19055 [Stenomitos sp.]
MSARASSALIVAGAIALTVSPARAETETGVALRQNALTVGWPNRPAGSPLPEGAMGMSETRLRAWLGQSWGGATFTGALEVQSALSTVPGSGLGILGGGAPTASRPYEVWDLSLGAASASAATTRARVERLDVAWSWGSVDLDVGRQPISLGTSHFVGVLDVLAPFAPGALDASYKPGIDAARVRTALGSSGEAEVIVAGRDPWGEGGTLGRLRTPLAGMDLELVSGRFRNRGFGGLGWEGELGPAGVWGELAWFQRRPEVEQYRAGGSTAFSGVVGADFSLPFETRLGTAFMYQDFGARRPEDLGAVSTDAPFLEGWAFLRSASYGVLTLSRPLHPLVNASLSGIVNLVDGSSLWQPRLTFSISDNSDLGAYGWIGAGAGPRVAGNTLTLGSEFGAVPTGVGLYARWFF